MAIGVFGRNWKVRLGIFAASLLVTVGVFAANDWFPKTDPMSGQKFGWFGKKVPKNSTASNWNPIQPPPPTPQLSREYLYAGSRLLAVEDANAVAAPPADIAIWRPSNGLWCVMGQTGSAQAFESWGVSSDVPMPGDYDADGKTDVAIYRPSTGYWWIYYTSTGTSEGISWGGTSGDKPVAADFDGDGKTDLAIVRWNSTTNVNDWFIELSGGSWTSVPWGANGDVPAAADFDGDGKADPAVYRASNDSYYWLRSSDGAMGSATPGDGDVVVPSDYDGDGKADPAVYKTSTAYWYIHQSTTNSVVSFQWGTSGDKPVQNDYDGDAKTDLATFTPHPTASIWNIKRSSNGTTRTEYWGNATDIPVPAYYRR